MLTVLGFNDVSTLVGHFVSSPREREKRDRRDSGGERNGEEIEETVEEMKGRDREEREQEWKWNKNNPPQPIPAARIAGLAQL